MMYKGRISFVSTSHVTAMLLYRVINEIEYVPVFSHLPLTNLFVIELSCSYEA